MKTCTVCRHPQRREIDAALLRGEPRRAESDQFGPKPTAVQRHRDHMAARVARAREAEETRTVAAVTALETAEVAHGDDLTAKLALIEAETRRLGAMAEAKGDTKTALLALREWLRVTELSARLSGQLRGDRVAVNVHLTDEAAARMAEIYLGRRPPAIEASAR